jgi:molybdate transport system substrate-binding protein
VIGVAGSSFTYAFGKLVVWSRLPGFVDNQGEVLRSGKFQRMAIANPKLSPYGAAAIETLTKLDLLQELRPKLVQGDNISQTYQFVASENAQLGFVALSQINAGGTSVQGSVWAVPQSYYKPIQQNAILLSQGQHASAALALMRYLRTDQAKALIRSFGYDLP